MSSINIVIPPSAGNTNLDIEFQGALFAPNTTVASFGLRINGDAAAKYVWNAQQSDFVIGGGLQAAHGGGDETRARIGWLPGSTRNPEDSGVYHIVIYNYNSIGFNKACTFSGGMLWDITHSFENSGFCSYSWYNGFPPYSDAIQSPPVSSIQLVTDVGAFDIGSSVEVYTF